MYDDPVVLSDLQDLASRIDKLEGAFEEVKMACAKPVSRGETTTYHAPWIVQYYGPYGTHGNMPGHVFDPSNPPASKEILANTDQQAHSNAETSSSKQRKLPDNDLRPILRRGALSDPSGHPRYQSPAVRLVEGFSGTFIDGYVDAVKDVSGHWEYFSEGHHDRPDTGSAEEMANLNLGGQGYWSPDTDHPTAEQVHQLRQRLLAEGRTDVTRDIDLSWVPDQNLRKEERLKLFATWAAERQKQQQQQQERGKSGNASQSAPNSSNNKHGDNPERTIQGSGNEEENIAKDTDHTPSVASEADSDNRRPSWRGQTPTEDNTIKVGVDKINPSAILNMEERTTRGQARAQSTSAQISKASRRTTRQMSAPKTKFQPTNAPTHKRDKKVDALIGAVGEGTSFLSSAIDYDEDKDLDDVADQEMSASDSEAPLVGPRSIGKKRHSVDASLQESSAPKKKPRKQRMSKPARQGPPLTKAELHAEIRAETAERTHARRGEFEEETEDGEGNNDADEENGDVMVRRRSEEDAVARHQGAGTGKGRKR